MSFFTKFLSRKFLMPIIYSVLAIVNSTYVLELPIEIIGALVGTFIFGETVIDTVNLKRTGTRVNGGTPEKEKEK